MVAGSCGNCGNINCNGCVSCNLNFDDCIIVNDPLRIVTKENCIFKIDSEGNVYFGKDQVKIDTENELALGFILVISDLTGISFSNGDKDEFILKMIQYFRERQLNKII